MRPAKSRDNFHFEGDIFAGEVNRFAKYILQYDARIALEHEHLVFKQESI